MLSLRVRVYPERWQKRKSAFPKAPALLEPHHQIVLCHIQDTLWAGWGLPFCRDAVGVFSNPRSQGCRAHVVGESYSSAGCCWDIPQPNPTGPQGTRCGRVLALCRVQLGYSATQVKKATGHTLWESLTSLQGAARGFCSPANWALVRGESYLPVEMQSVYSMAPADWARLQHGSIWSLGSMPYKPL